MIMRALPVVLLEIAQYPRLKGCVWANVETATVCLPEFISARRDGRGSKVFPTARLSARWRLESDRTQTKFPEKEPELFQRQHLGPHGSVVINATRCAVGWIAQHQCLSDWVESFGRDYSLWKSGGIPGRDRPFLSVVTYRGQVSATSAYAGFFGLL